MVCQINSSCCMVVVVGVGRVTKVVCCWFLDGQPNLLSIQRELCNQTDQSRNPINLSKNTFHLNSRQTSIQTTTVTTSFIIKALFD